MNTKKQNISSKSDYLFINKNKLVLWISILVGGIIIGVAINSYNTQEPVYNSVSEVFSFKTLDIAKQFSCSCGSCGEKELIACTCPTAVETKQYIEASLNKGLSAEDVTKIVKMSYGHYKG
jgi:cytochrome c-type biogenesis protein CcmH/NrfF